MTPGTAKRRILPARLLPIMLIAALLIAACGGTPDTTQPVATEPSVAASAAPSADAPAASVVASASADAAAPAASAAATGDFSGLMTVSAQQQATWVRNFNPFVGDYRYPAREGMYEPMMVYNTATGELVPWLATEFAWSDDTKKLTFTTREGVNWSDGQPFTAKDVAFTFNLFNEKEGLQGNGSGAWEYLEAVSAPDDTTVEFTFSKVFTVGLYDIATQFIVPEHLWKDVEDPVKFTNEHPVATGPFTEVTNFQNQIYEVRKNPNYWQEGKPYFEGMRFPSYPGNDQANLATINGENDWAANFIPDIEKTYVAKDPENHHYWFPSTGNDVMLYVNTTKKPFDDPNVRKAISMCLNREQMVTVAMYDYTHPADATGLSDAYEKWKSAEAVAAGTWVTRDVAKANEMLDTAGLAQGPGGTRSTADGQPMKYEINVVSGWTDWVSAVQIMSQNLKECGIEASVKTYDYSAWFERVQTGNFDISIGWSSGGATPLNFYRGVMSTASLKPVGDAAGENWHRYASTDADQLLDQFAGTSDFEEQKQIGNQLQMLFVNEAPAIPLFPGPQWYEFNTKNFTGFPDADNPYTLGSTYALESVILMTTVKPK